MLYYIKQESIVLYCPANGIQDNFLLIKKNTTQKETINSIG